MTKNPSGYQVQPGLIQVEIYPFKDSHSEVTSYVQREHSWNHDQHDQSNAKRWRPVETSKPPKSKRAQTSKSTRCRRLLCIGSHPQIIPSTCLAIWGWSCRPYYAKCTGSLVDQNQFYQKYFPQKWSTPLSLFLEAHKLWRCIPKTNLLSHETAPAPLLQITTKHAGPKRLTKVEQEASGLMMPSCNSLPMLLLKLLPPPKPLVPPLASNVVLMPLHLA